LDTHDVTLYGYWIVAKHFLGGFFHTKRRLWLSVGYQKF